MFGCCLLLSTEKRSSSGFLFLEDMARLQV